VHPGYLVDDPKAIQRKLISDVGALEDKLDLWLVAAPSASQRPRRFFEALLAPPSTPNSRRCLAPCSISFS